MRDGAEKFSDFTRKSKSELIERIIDVEMMLILVKCELIRRYWFGILKSHDKYGNQAVVLEERLGRYLWSADVCKINF